MTKMLQHALAERAAVQRQIAALDKQAGQLDKVIALLGREAEPPAKAKAKARTRGRKATAEQRQKMRDAWVRRKQKQRAAKKAGEPTADAAVDDSLGAELVDARG